MSPLDSHGKLYKHCYNCFLSLASLFFHPPKIFHFLEQKIKTRNGSTRWRLQTLPLNKRRDCDWIILTARHSRAEWVLAYLIRGGMKKPIASLQASPTLTRFARSFFPLSLSFGRLSRGLSVDGKHLMRFQSENGVFMIFILRLTEPETPEEFENKALVLRLGLWCKLIRHVNGASFSTDFFWSY